MSELKFTPAPWYYDGDWGIVSDVIVDNESAKDIVCSFDDATANDAEIDANAHLISSAPDLSAALEHAVQMLRVHGETCAVAIRALAKARGEK